MKAIDTFPRQSTEENRTTKCGQPRRATEDLVDNKTDRVMCENVTDSPTNNL